MPLPKILFLDDEAELLEMLKDYFEDIAEVRIFSNPEEAVKSALADPPKIAFLDYRLPGTTGIEVSKRFPPGVQLYLLTGELEVDCPPQITKVLVKPIQLAEVSKLIQSFNLPGSE
jgi:DNA-binding response OmpR family regulator